LTETNNVYTKQTCLTLPHLSRERDSKYDLYSVSPWKKKKKKFRL